MGEIFIRAAILFHSVTGSCYDMAMTIQQEFEGQHIDSTVLRIQDDDQKQWGEMFDLAKEYHDRIMAVQPVKIDDMPSYDVLIICSPTYFGNVSAEVKSFMDDMACYYLDRRMAGKKVVACASASTPMGGGDMALQAISTFAQHMGMIPLPINTLSMPAYGLLHIAGEESQHRVGDDTRMRDAAETLAITLSK